MTQNKVFLIGYMGVGKTTLGKKLAKQLEVEFIDVDSVIEDKTQLTISAIFEEFGEKKFREIERETLLEIIANENKAVVSVGGGLPCYFDNMDVMNNTGTTIYLQRPAKELFHRLKNAKEQRPMISRFDDEKELLKYIENHLEEREKYYLKAKIIVGREDLRVETLVSYVS